MKSSFSERPAAVMSYGSGTYMVNYDVREVVRCEDGESVIDYECESVIIDGHVTYEKVVEALVRVRYGVSDELAILRQRDLKPREFADYDAYCEECKRIAREVVA